jgi:NADH-quinone oxidoreductase subunit C/D
VTDATAPGMAADPPDGLAGIGTADVLGPGGMPCSRTTAPELPSVLGGLKRRGYTHLSLLTAEEAEGGVDLVYGVTDRLEGKTVIVKAALADGDLSAPSISDLWTGANPLEREVYDLFGVTFEGHPGLSRIVLRDDFVGHPLRKGFPMGEHGVTTEQLEWALSSHGEAPHPEYSPFAVAGRPGDEVLHSERIVLNMGPQHPSMHGVLHVYVALEGEKVLAAQPTHGYLHRCIEKLCEQRSYRACNALLDRSDYVSGFHTELAFTLALEELLGVEPTPKADNIRVLLGELVRITSHDTWFAAAGLDTGALTPFLYAFIDREKLLDYFEAITGARMMFNYFRPGGVKMDLPPGVTEDLHRYLLTLSKGFDDCEALLTNNEIFRARTRGVGLLRPSLVESYCVTGPMARASGVDIDLRRDEPYSAYREIPVNVPLGTTGDTYDRYTVRVAEMRESLRIALAALEGMPEGPHVAEGVPRSIRPPAGTAYRRVESPRGELGVYLVSDGSSMPWRLKVRSPAFSNLHAAPPMLEGCTVADIVAILGSVDVVMGEIDR